ncbi:hypothetical protein CRG98_030215 [Punica granatum]|uniref:Uncharacterized protein n=1 Tax=Punica granatum TaxID=22663 RepID=A0A2I0IZH0_PUNGR|nr:hypothetical protein CRG98_030215 [Punica granatum]
MWSVHAGHFGNHLTLQRGGRESCKRLQKGSSGKAVAGTSSSASQQWQAQGVRGQNSSSSRGAQVHQVPPAQLYVTVVILAFTVQGSTLAFTEKDGWIEERMRWKGKMDGSSWMYGDEEVEEQHRVEKDGLGCRFDEVVPVIEGPIGEGKGDLGSPDFRVSSN